MDVIANTNRTRRIKTKALKINAKASEWDLQTPIIIESIGWVD